MTELPISIYLGRLKRRSPAPLQPTPSPYPPNPLLTSPLKTQFQSEEFSRPVTVDELTYWSDLDLETLLAEVDTAISNITLKIECATQAGTNTIRLFSARKHALKMHHKIKLEKSARITKINEANHRRKLETRELHNEHMKKLAEKKQHQMILYHFKKLLIQEFDEALIEELYSEACDLKNKQTAMMGES